MSTTITSTTTTYYSDSPVNDPGKYPPPAYGDSSENGDITSYGNTGGKSPNAYIDSLNIPESFKNILRDMLAKSGGDGSGGMSDAAAAKTINQFQKDNDIGLLSASQVKQMADTGYYTDKNGKSQQVPPEVQAAAVKMMSNNGELFKKLESATDGKHDGQLGQGDYGRAVKDGTISGNPAPQEYGLSKGFLNTAVMNGHVSPNHPDDYDAAKTMNKFQKDNDIGLLSAKQMNQIAETGYYTDKNGKDHQVTPDVQAAAQTFMDNGGALFKKLESATDGKHDGQLGQGDFGEAVKDGTIAQGQGHNYSNPPPPYGADTSPPAYTPGNFGQGNGQGNNLPSEASAAKTIKSFQEDNGTGLLSAQQMKQMAETGYYTDKDGKSHQVTPEVQAAAQKYMENGGEMFKKVESAHNGKHDGQLSTTDADDARKDGSLSSVAGNGSHAGNPPAYTDAPPAYTPGNYGNGNGQGNNLPSEASAAKTIKGFQDDHHIGLLSAQDMKQMADTGYYTDKLGQQHQVPPDVQAAAQKYMENGGEMFKKVESAHNGKHDGQLSSTDAEDARKDGSLSSTTGNSSRPPAYTDAPPAYTPGNYGNGNGNGQGNNLPSDKTAVDTMQSFQKDKDIGLLSAQQMNQIADTGYYTDKDGNDHQVTPDVQAAAQKYMDNGGELFKKIEAATDGKHDGLLGQGDPDEARKDGTVAA